MRRTALAAALLAVLALAPPAAAHGRYVVRPGDTLSGIALRVGTSAERLARLNGLALERPILVGERLRVPHVAAARRRTLRGRYVVRPGDTLSGIASRFGIGLALLAHANRLDAAGVLLAGTGLRVPAGRPRRRRTAARRYLAWVRPLPRERVRALIVHWSRHYGVDAKLSRSLAWQESGFQTNIVSAVGAWGVMQVTPSTWRYVERDLIGHRVPASADGNVRIGVALLHHLLHAFGGRRRLALAAYYQGERSVRARGLLRETRAYVRSILAIRRML